MSAQRHNHQSVPFYNLPFLLDVLNDPDLERLTLFATTRDLELARQSGVTTANVPLLAALAQFRQETEALHWTVFDGLIATAAREQRADEITVFLNGAVNNNKVYYSITPAPFTNLLPPEEAANILSLQRATPLTSDNRRDFWAMLSGVREKASLMNG